MLRMCLYCVVAAVYRIRPSAVDDVVLILHLAQEYMRAVETLPNP